MLVQMTGYEPVQKPVEIKPGETVEIDVLLQAQAAPAAPAAAPTPAPPFAGTAAPPPVVESTLSKSWIPITMFGVGVLAGGYGVWALHRNHDKTGSCSSLDAPTTCERYSSKTVGAMALVGGGFLAAAGLAWEIVILVRDAQSGTTTRHVSLAPDNVAFTVRF